MGKKAGGGAKGAKASAGAVAPAAAQAGGKGKGGGGGGGTVVRWPEGGAITRNWLRQLASSLDYASRNLPPEELPLVMPVETADAIMMSAHKLFHKEPNVVRIDPEASLPGSLPEEKGDADVAASREEGEGQVAMGTDEKESGNKQARNSGEAAGEEADEESAEPMEADDQAPQEQSTTQDDPESERTCGGEDGGNAPRGEGPGGAGADGAATGAWQQRSLAPGPHVEVVVIGDVHGQFHDVLHLLRLIGDPGKHRFCVFNGDYVDRGTWGVETYLLLLAWKVFAPERVIMLRGNHESKFCIAHYGFERELHAKYGPDAKHLLRRFLACFESHPLAAVIGGATFVCHGGLFRKPVSVAAPGAKGGGGKGKGGKKGGKCGKAGGDSGSKGGGGKKSAPVLGSLKDLEAARRSILDPCGSQMDAVLSDVLWSDPALRAGLSHNSKRGIGLLFGPDCTQEFLQENNLKLIIRSHEGPDAREKRPEMGAMKTGLTEDHVVEAGRLLTLFSAPDYPQFQAGKFRTKNRAAFIRLSAPSWSDPKVEHFDAILPRPKATPFYDFIGGPDSDSELELGGSDDDSSDYGSDSGSSTH